MNSKVTKYRKKNPIFRNFKTPLKIIEAKFHVNRMLLNFSKYSMPSGN